MDSMDIILNVSGIVDDSIVDGPGLRYTIFVQGCPHHCPGCHNPQTHSYKGGKQMTLKKLLTEIKSNPLLYGVTFSGGEPFDQAKALAVLGREVRKLGLHLMAYSGYTYEELEEKRKTEPEVGELLDEVQLLVDGRYEQDLRDLTLLYRGSENQRLVDLDAMRNAGDLQTVVLWQEDI